MAVTVKKKIADVKGLSVKDKLKALQKTYGETIGNFGGILSVKDRIPTGLFPFDMALGGGFPKGRCSTIYGPEDSAKTSVAYKLIANHQRLWPDETCVYVAVEPFDAGWAAQLGVDTEKLAVINPLLAEETVDMVTDMLSGDDCGLLVLDSIAAMITTQEHEKSATGFNPGSAALAVGKLVRKTALALRDAEIHGRAPTLLYINQTRYKIGVMFGNPEIMPGGNAPLFQAQVIVRLNSRPITDAKVSDAFPVIREIEMRLKKYKVPILGEKGTSLMVTYAHGGLAIGETDDINTITAYLKDFGVMFQLKKGWSILDVEYPTIKAFKDRVYMDKDFGSQVRAAIIERLIDDKKGGQVMGSDEPGIVVDADGVIIEKQSDA